MDPNRTWQDLAQAVADGDWETAGELAEDLLGWLGSGGFPPEITGHREFDLIAAKNACDAIMAWDV